MSIRPFNGIMPVIKQTAYIDEQAVVIGDVQIGEDSSVWPNTVIRGDVNIIRIGQRSNIQDNSTIHVSHDSYYQPGGAATQVGDDVTIGHQVILHACHIGNRCLIGMGSIIMDQVVVADDTIIAAGSLVTQGQQLTGGQLYVGRPAKPVRALTDEERERIQYSAQHYVKLKNQYMEH